MKQQSLFEDTRLSRAAAVELTIDYLKDYFSRYKHVAIAFSGGKDSSATVSLVVWAIESGLIPRPESLTVVYADTRLELPPLFESAMAILADIRRRGFDTKIAIAPIEKRMLPYILGRGVPPPKNDFRWCTRQIKIEPMQAAMSELLASIGDERLLMLTGMRLGESAIRDRRILTSCSKDGGECGQGHFQSSTTERIDTFAPILHWRVCHVWDWLLEADILYGVPTAQVAEVYGGDEKEELNARTGCIGCPLASKDLALDNLIRNDKYRSLAPLKQMRPIYEAMRSPDRRLRKDGETLKDGSLSSNPYRMGPLTPESREYFLDLILEIQTSINIDRGDRPRFDLIDTEEERFIRTCIEDRIFPNGWSGDEPIANISPLTPLEILLKHAD